MTLAVHASRSSGALVLCASLVTAAGCSSTQAAYQGTGGSGFAGGAATSGNASVLNADGTAQTRDAIAQAAQCGPTDSTVSCCLKQHPGDYERCGALGPKQAPK